HGDRQQSVGALCRRGAGKNSDAGHSDSFHSGAAAGTVSTKRASGGGQVVALPRWTANVIANRQGDRGGSWFLGVLALVAVAAPLLNLAVPASSPLHLST